jgi:MYXO-CTERM domain-containing protein
MNSIKLSAAALIFTGSAFADFGGASFTVEEVVSGYDTYRIFLNFTSPADKLLAVNGDVAGGYTALSYEGGELYNVQVATPFGTAIDDTGAYSAAEVFAGDSYVTIGGQSDDVAFSPNFLDDNVNGFGERIQGSSFSWENNGGYFDSDPGSGAFDSGSGVLVAQLTVAAGEDITFGGTASFNSEAGDLTFASFSVTSVPAPGALALLGLAGLGRRRRG